MNNTFPCITISDLETTIDWYKQFLGFECTYRNSLKNPDYVLLEKGLQKIYLIKDENPETYAPNFIVIETSDLQAAYAAMEKANVIIVQPIHKGVFSGKEFVIKDYEDNKIIYRRQT